MGIIAWRGWNGLYESAWSKYHLLEVEKFVWPFRTVCGIVKESMEVSELHEGKTFHDYPVMCKRCFKIRRKQQ